MLTRLRFNLMYLSSPPWDSGISPPELLEFIESHQPGRALDLGCGTGTNVITLAKASWRAEGVDFIGLAIQKARRKGRQAGVRAKFRVEDVTRLVNTRGPFDLILDMGCFHNLDRRGKEAYAHNLEWLLAPTGTFMLYTFLKDTPQEGRGVEASDLELIKSIIPLEMQKNGSDRGGRRSAWFWFRRYGN